ncbi:MAG: glycosyltransferase family 39 protein, partial [Endomicrobia bacterium]|nr:glycosyltransferase family 39 protein [Endomicrobiia bacterium]
MKDIFNKFSAFAEKHKTFLAFFLLAVAVLAVYGRSVKYDFVYCDDDGLVISNYGFMSDFKNIPEFFRKSVFNSAADNYYRPAMTLSFWADAVVFGKNPFGYRLTNILLHIAAVFLVYVLLARLKFGAKFAFLFALLFAVHPAFAQTVAWIPGRNDSLLAVFAVASMLFLLDYFQDGKKKRDSLFLSGLMFLAAIFTKENAAVMIFTLPAFVYVFCENAKKRDYIKITGMLILIAAVYGLMRMTALRGAEGTSTIVYMLRNVFGSMKMVFVYLEYALLPYRMYVIPVSVPPEPLTAAACAMAAVPLAGSLIFKTGRKKVVLFGLFWFLMFLLPSFVIANYWFSHRLYVPFIGIVVMFMEFFSAAAHKHPEAKKYFLLLLAGITAVFAVASYMQTQKFKDRIAFYGSAAAEQPLTETVRLRLVSYYINAGMLA